MACSGSFWSDSTYADLNFYNLNLVLSVIGMIVRYSIDVYFAVDIAVQI